MTLINSKKILVGRRLQEEMRTTGMKRKRKRSTSQKEGIPISQLLMVMLMEKTKTSKMARTIK
jgi:LDH2 family malate/lactate/ureidoglycolate dehydrogenase